MAFEMLSKFVVGDFNPLTTARADLGAVIKLFATAQSSYFS